MRIHPDESFEFKFNPNESELFQVIPIFVFKTFRVKLKNVSNLVDENRLKVNLT